MTTRFRSVERVMMFDGATLGKHSDTCAANGCKHAYTRFLQSSSPRPP